MKKYKNTKDTKNNKKFYLLITTIILIVFLFIFVNNDTNSKTLKNTKNFIMTTKQTLIKPINKLSLKIKNIGKYNDIIKENEKLKEENLLLSMEKDSIENIKKDIKNLQNMLNLQNIYSNRKIIIGQVIDRNILYWFNNINISIGSSNGVNIGDAIVSDKGLIGKVVEVYNSYSVVRLITNNNDDFKISVSIDSKDGIISGSISGYKDGYIIVDNITNLKHSLTNAKVLTSGIGTFPKNILIGEVEKEITDTYKIEKTLYIKPASNFEDITYIAAIGN